MYDFFCADYVIPLDYEFYYEAIMLIYLCYNVVQDYAYIAMLHQDNKVVED